MSNELNVLLDQPEVVEVNGEKIEIKVFKIGKYPTVIKYVNKVGANWLETMSKKMTQKEMGVQLLRMLDTSGEDVLDFLAYAIDKDRTWVDQLEVDQAIELLVKVIKTNFHFFTVKVLPSLTALSAQGEKTAKKP